MGFGGTLPQGGRGAAWTDDFESICPPLFPSLPSLALNDFLTHPMKKSEDSQGQGGESLPLKQMFSGCRGAESKCRICCRVHINMMRFMCDLSVTEYEAVL